ncbi:MAG: phosphatidylserine decarboxylase family protein [Thermoplasmata archaeon]|nr:MAG: phosphatidylserine decarboxylase family protein [Thermoplasmata archaeon]
MKLAHGALSWVTTSLFMGFVFLFLFIIFNGFETSIVFFFIGFIFFLLTLFFIIFFRDPEREVGEGVVACADGKIREITSLKDEDIGESIKVSTFMNVYNVHVNRMPFDGVIKDIKHVSGSYVPAFKKESERNERVIILVDTEIGILKIIQIAGTLARRIVLYIKNGDKVKKGEKIGMIRLGSRVDIYLPSKSIKMVNVKVGDRVKAGCDTIAEIND